jgi:hypothetical protein
VKEENKTIFWQDISEVDRKNFFETDIDPVP